MKPSADGMLKAISRMGSPAGRGPLRRRQHNRREGGQGGGHENSLGGHRKVHFERLTQEGSDYVLNSLSELVGFI